MVAALVQSKAGTAATSGKVATVKPDSNVTAGNLLVVGVVRSTTTTDVDLPIVTITDDTAATAAGGTLPGTPPSFNPADWGTHLAFFDPSNAGTITESGGQVSSLAAVSGSKPTAMGQANASFRPITGTRTSPSGLNTLDFDGVDDCLFGNPADESQPFTAVVVCKSDTTTAGAGNNRQALSDFAALYLTSASSNWRMYAGTELDSGDATDTGWHVLLGYFNGGSSELWLDGVQIAVGSAGTNALGQYCMGGFPTFETVTGWDGPIGAAVYYQGNVSNKAGLMAALKARWIDVPAPVAAPAGTAGSGNKWKQCEEAAELGILFDAGTHQHGCELWYCENATGGSRPTITATLQGFPPLDTSAAVLGRMVVFVLEYSGFSGFEPFQTGGVKWTTGTTVSAVTRDSVDANSLLVSIAIYNGSAATIPAGWNSRFTDATSKVVIADLLDSGAAGAKTAAWTGLTSNTKGAAIIIAMKTAGVRSSGDIRCVRFQYRLEELGAAPVTVPRGTARSPAFAAPSVGNSLILYTGAYGGGDVVEVTDDHGNQWEQLYDSGYDPNGNGSNSLWIVRRAVSDFQTLTITATAVVGQGTGLMNQAMFALWEYTNLPATTDVLASNVVVGDLGSGTGIASASITSNLATSTSPQLAIGVVAGGIDNFAGLDHGAGWTSRYTDSGAENQMIDKVTNGGATQTATWTWDLAQVATYFVVVLGARPISFSPTVIAQRRLAFSAPSLPAYIGQRAETVEWEVLDADNTPVGLVSPVGVGASVRHDVSSDIIRSVDGLELTETDCATMNMLTTRIRPVWVMDDLSRWPLGVFLFQAADRHPRTLTGTSTRTMSMYDQNALLLDKRRETFGLTRGSSVRNAMIQLIEECHIPRYSIGATGAVAGDDLAWPPATPRLKILRHLCALGALLRPYFDNTGTLIIRSSPDLESVEPDVSYDTGPASRIHVESIVIAQDLFDVPNVYLVTASGATESEVSAYAIVPATEPHSALNRGREIVEELKLPGITDTTAALAAAQAHAAQRLGDFLTYEFEGAPDPRHDTFMIVGVDGVNYREVAWRLDCKPGGTHSHSLRGTYTLVQDPTDTAPSGVGPVRP